MKFESIEDLLEFKGSKEFLRVEADNVVLSLTNDGTGQIRAYFSDKIAWRLNDSRKNYPEKIKSVFDERGFLFFVADDNGNKVTKSKGHYMVSFSSKPLAEELLNKGWMRSTYPIRERIAGAYNIDIKEGREKK